jgi:hypothetical protein
MKSFKRTNPAAGHDHLLFLDDSRGDGTTAVVDGHAHKMQWVDPVDPQIDPNTGQPVIDPNTGQPDQGQPGHWQMSPGPDGHTHEGFSDIPETQGKLPQQEDDEAVREVLQLFRAWTDGESLSIEAGRESEEFYSGKQWSDSDKSLLSSQSRACLTINFTEKGIDTISGYERQQRTDIHYLPVEGTDQKAADLYNILTKALLDACNFAREKSESFEDCAITGRSGWNIYVTFDNDLRGEVIVERFPYDQFAFGPHEKRDASDAEGFVKYRWYSRGKVNQLWPDKADEINEQFAIPVDIKTDVDSTQPGNETGIHGSNGVAVEYLPLIDVERKNILVIECQRYVYVKVTVLANPQEDFYFNAWGWAKADIAAALTIPGFNKIERNVRKVRITKLAGRTLLSDENPADLPSDKFHFIPFYAKRRKGQFWGKVESVKDLQREVNKRASQAIDIGNRMAAYNWFYDRETFPDNELQRFKDGSSTPGAVFEVNSTSRLPSKTEGTKFPSEIVQLRETAAADIEKIMNVVPEQPGANTSGSAMLQREKAKMTANQYLFESLTDATTRLGRLLVPIIKRYYPAERILRIVRSAAAKSPQKVDGQDISEFSDEDIMTILEQSDLEKFDLVVSESSTSPSARFATWLVLTDMNTKSPGSVPQEMIITYSDMPENEKKKVLENLAAQQQAQAQQAEQEGNAEIEKTLVGQGIISPVTAQKFQVQPQQLQQPADPAAQPATAAPAPQGGLSEGAPQQQQSPINVTVAPPAVTVNVDTKPKPTGRRVTRHLMEKMPDGNFMATKIEDEAQPENPQEQVFDSSGGEQ